MSASKTVFPQPDPQVLEIKMGGGCLSVFGLPFLLAGLFVMQIPLGLIPMKMEGAQPWYLQYILAAMGLVFAAVGGALVFGRKGVILDLRAETILVWSGLLVPMNRTEYQLGLIKSIRIKQNAGDSDTPTTYPVHLIGDGSFKEILLHDTSDYQKARQAAEQVASFLGKPIEDVSTGKKVIREAAELNLSVLEKAAKEEKVWLPSPPPDMRTKIEQTGDGLMIGIPGPPLTVFSFLPLLPALIFSTVAFIFLRGLLSLPSPDFVRIFFGVFLCLFIAGPILGVLSSIRKKSRQSERIEVTWDLLRVTQNAGRKMTAREIPLSELEELTLPTSKDVMDSIEMPGQQPTPNMGDTGGPRMPDGRPAPSWLLALSKLAKSQGIFARSDKTTIQFAAGLSEEEAKYIYALIKDKIGRPAK